MALRIVSRFYEEKTDSKLTAYLCGYDFLAQKRKEDYCRDLPLRIELNNKELFRGTIKTE